MSKKHIVIVGGGFAGMACAKKLAGNETVHITLLEKNNYHQFKPLLYQVATCALTPDDAATPLRRYFEEYNNIDVKMAEVASIDPKTLTASTKEGQKFQGDILVLAAGSKVNFFGVEGAQENAYPLYTLTDAEILRSKVLNAFERADKNPSLIDEGLLNFVIVGAGPTGTEIAGALADLFHISFPKEYPDIPVSKARIYLVDHGSSPLKAFSKESQSYAEKVLGERGVQFKFGLAVKGVDDGKVLLSDNSTISSKTVIWAGGLEAAAIEGIEHGKGGRIDILPDLSVKGFPSIYALGDFANIEVNGSFLPQLASVAVQCGAAAGENILADCQGKPRKPFSYHDKGIMAMIGKNAAVAEVGKKRHVLEGPIAFAAWLGVHAMLLPSYRQRLEAFVEWGWNYFGTSQPFQLLDQKETLEHHEIKK